MRTLVTTTAALLNIFMLWQLSLQNETPSDWASCGVKARLSTTAAATAVTGNFIALLHSVSAGNYFTSEIADEILPNREWEPWKRNMDMPPGSIDMCTER
jgi:hypothetical protein